MLACSLFSSSILVSSSFTILAAPSAPNCATCSVRNLGRNCFYLIKKKKLPNPGTRNFLVASPSLISRYADNSIMSSEFTYTKTILLPIECDKISLSFYIPVVFALRSVYTFVKTQVASIPSQIILQLILA